MPKSVEEGGFVSPPVKADTGSKGRRKRRSGRAFRSSLNMDYVDQRAMLDLALSGNARLIEREPPKEEPPSIIYL